MERGEIWSVNLEPTVGSEQQGQRPVLVVSKKELNNTLGVAMVCPITGGGSAARYKDLAVSLIGSGTKTDGVVLCHQIRAMDLKARRGRRIEKAPDYIVREVLDCLADLLE